MSSITVLWVGGWMICFFGLKKKRPWVEGRVLELGGGWMTWVFWPEEKVEMCTDNTHMSPFKTYIPNWGWPRGVAAPQLWTQISAWYFICFPSFAASYDLNKLKTNRWRTNFFSGPTHIFFIGSGLFVIIIEKAGQCDTMAADVMPAQQNPVKEERYDHRAKRTQAIPKRTLFGSVIERLDEDDKKSLLQIDVKELENTQRRERIERKNRYKPKLPDYIKNQLPGKYRRCNRSVYSSYVLDAKLYTYKGQILSKAAQNKFSVSQARLRDPHACHVVYFFPVTQEKKNCLLQILNKN